MKYKFFFVVSLMMGLMSTAQADELDMQVLACGTVKVSTNSAEPGRFGAAVMTTSIVTSRNVFKLQASSEESSELISNLQNGSKVTFFGIAKGVESSHQLKRNADGSIDLTPLFVTPGCH